MPEPVTFIIGCTGCGKGAVGRTLARHLNAEILSVDSMKVFRRMDIGTAKPTPGQRGEIRHHLIDVVEPSQPFSVAEFVQQARQAIAEIRSRGVHILAVGGTALYIKALSEGLFEGPSADPQVRSRLHAEAKERGTQELHARLAAIDPVAAGRIHPNDLRRIVRALEVHELTGTPISELQVQWDRTRTVFDCAFIGLRREREDQARRANARVKRMIEQGLVEEVRGLLAERPPIGSTARQALGYAEIIAHLENEVPLEEAVENIKINTRSFIKAQRTWFKRFRTARWIDVSEDDTAESVAGRILSLEDTPWSTSPK